MREVTLKPIYDYDKYTEHIEKVLVFELYYHIFRPLLDIMGVEGRKPIEVRVASRWNAPGSAVKRALESGKITYSEPYFYGSFEAAIGRELRSMGARFDSRKKAYRLELGRVPMDLKLSITSSRLKLQTRIERIKSKLEEISKSPFELSIGSYTQNIMDDLGKQFERTVKPNLEVPMHLSEGANTRLQENYAANTNLYIQDWKEEQVERLKEQINKNAAEGYRSDKMIARIQAEYNITRNRARLIARNETALLVSKYREERYKEAGLRQYKWSTSGDERVREDHKDLNGRVFSWDSPPVVDKATGRRGNPGEDINCRCIAVPVLRLGE